VQSSRSAPGLCPLGDARRVGVRHVCVFIVLLLLRTARRVVVVFLLRVLVSGGSDLLESLGALQAW
jgi:hypothetical protein